MKCIKTPIIGKQLDIIKPKLMSLGYTDRSFTYYKDHPMKPDDKFLYIGMGRLPDYKSYGIMELQCLSIDHEHYPEYRINVDEFNEDLILALATIHQNERVWKIGEIGVSLNDSINVDKGDLVRYDEVGKYGDGNANWYNLTQEKEGDRNFNKDFHFFRKATYEEIIEHYTSKEIKQIVMSKLPSKFAYRVDSGSKDQLMEVLTFINSNCSNNFFNGSASNGSYYVMNIETNKSDCHTLLPKDYTAITYEQFKVMTNQNIIGYECPMDLRNGAVPKGSVYVPDPTSSLMYITKTKDGTSAVLEKEIVETWKPVYKEVNLKISLGTPKFDIEIDKSGRIVINKWETTTTVDSVRKIITKLEQEFTFASYDAFIVQPTIHIGCGDGPNVTLTELREIVRQFNRFTYN
jgi:hypothetical protein